VGERRAAYTRRAMGMKEWGPSAKMRMLDVPSSIEKWTPHP
jgi:hypothetical protein